MHVTVVRKACHPQPLLDQWVVTTAAWTRVVQEAVWLQAAVAQMVAAELLEQVAVVLFVAEQAAFAVVQIVVAEQVVAVERLVVAAVAATADTVVAVAVGRAVVEQVDSRPVAADSRSSARADHSPAVGRAVAAVHNRQTDSTADQELACFSCPDCRGFRPRRAAWNGSYLCLYLAMIQNADGHPRRSCFLWSSFWRNSRPNDHR